MTLNFHSVPHFRKKNKQQRNHKLLDSASTRKGKLLPKGKAKIFCRLVHTIILQRWGPPYTLWRCLDKILNRSYSCFLQQLLSSLIQCSNVLLIFKFSAASSWRLVVLEWSQVWLSWNVWKRSREAAWRGTISLSLNKCWFEGGKASLILVKLSNISQRWTDKFYFVTRRYWKWLLLFMDHLHQTAHVCWFMTVLIY